MSGLVFVRDAQGRPLMPMSAAYARTLVHQGKAQVIPHPAVSTIQLTRMVTTPTLRPVIVGLALNDTTIDVMITVEQARTLPATFHIIIDLRVPVTSGKIPSQWTIYRRRLNRSSHPRVSSNPWRYASALRAVIAAWRQLIPISHLVLVPSRRISALPSIRAAWIGRQIQRRTGNIPFTHQDDRVTEHLPVSLMQLLINSLGSAPNQSPNVVCIITGSGIASHKGTNWSTRRRPQQRHMAETPEYRGRLGTIRQAGSNITGIIQRLGSFDQPLLWIPTQVDDHGIHWKSILIPNQALLHIWPSTRILMMPLKNSRHRPDSLP